MVLHIIAAFGALWWLHNHHCKNNIHASAPPQEEQQNYFIRYLKDGYFYLDNNILKLNGIHVTRIYVHPRTEEATKVFSIKIKLMHGLHFQMEDLTCITLLLK